MNLEWGEQGIKAFEADVYVIIDVLSFSSCVDIALRCGAEVLPFRYKDERAQTFADQQQALLAVNRDQAGYSLSPASLQNLPSQTRLVLPSPNGASLSLLTENTPTLCAGLRNAAAIAEWLRTQNYQRVQLVPAGERWPDGSLRPAIEDWLGAGAVLAGLEGEFSPEAALARKSFNSHKSDLAELIRACQSGQELIQRGFPQDVELAVQLNVSSVVPGFGELSYRNLQNT